MIDTRAEIDARRHPGLPRIRRDFNVPRGYEHHTAPAEAQAERAKETKCGKTERKAGVMGAVIQLTGGFGPTLSLSQ